MEEVQQLCTRMLGEGASADDAAAQARARGSADRVGLLAAAAQACRERAEPQQNQGVAEMRDTDEPRAGLEVPGASPACDDGAGAKPVMTAPARSLRTTRGTLELGGRPWLMGVVNASPDSFSDGGRQRTLRERVELARTLLAAGADMIDIGGESAVTNRPAVSPREEIERVLPLVERVSGELGALVSIDTYKPAVARAAIEAGAAIVNDVSALRDPALADVCAATGAGLVVMHTRAAPKQKLLDPGLDGRIVADVQAILRERLALALAHGVAFEQLMIDPGPDFAKTPAQTVEVLRALGHLHALGRPLLLAVSRKDFIGALTGRAPRDRLSGTLAAITHGVDAGAHVLRVHDVAAVADFLAVRAVLRGESEPGSQLRISDELRWEQVRHPQARLEREA